MVEYLKKAEKSPATGEDETRQITAEILQKIEAGGEETARDYGRTLDGYEGEIVVSEDVVKAAGDLLSQQVKDDIQWSVDRVRGFAEKQKDSITDFVQELSPGVFAGQKSIPINTAGCYVPGGRYSHVASAIMSIATAKVAGVKNVIACSAPRGNEGVHPAILYTMSLCGADQILALGGVQAVAAMTFGLFTGKEADIIVGPGNRFVAEAKRILYGRVGIDMFAGPTEILVIADKSADTDIIAMDIVSQVEHGPDSPGWLIVDDKNIAEQVESKILALIDDLPELQKNASGAAWRDYGEIILCENREEMCQISDRYAPEHLEVLAEDLEWYLETLTNYGSLFLGEETTVTFGDKCSGTNHILPTKGVARYSGGLSVGKFTKTVTYQKATRDGNREMAAVAARISRVEGMEGHARAGDIRLAKYFPEEKFDLGTLGKYGN
jgi:sulfopropanediol 3-dehydrogenase